MADDAARPRLGRGLAALIGDFSDDAPREDARPPQSQRKVVVEFLRPNPRNPRRRFSEPELDELAASIRQRGVIQPIVARPLPAVPGTFEIVAGERRWRAAQRAGITEVPVVVVEIDDRTSLEYAILENVQRTDLNAIWGGIGCCLQQFVVYLLLSVFLAGLMTGRTPELFGRNANNGARHAASPQPTSSTLRIGRSR